MSPGGSKATLSKGFLSSSSSTAEEQEAGLQKKFPNDEYNQIMILVNWLAAFGFIFATLKDHVGVRSIELQIPAQTNVAGLKSLLVEKFPMLRGLMSHMLISVNREYAFDDAIIPDAAEIALFPPVSGG